VFSEKEIQALFNKYDTDRSGKLCYDEFCGLIAHMGSGMNANLNPVFEL
jgi:calcyphosin